jgi:hypothetical protein
VINIAGFDIDIAVSEEHTFDAEVTAHPVEVGSDIADNVRLLPFSLALDCTVSDTPFGEMQRKREATGTTIPSRDALAFLKDLRKTREPFTVVTSLGSYVNLILRSLVIPRSADTGHALKFRATFQEVELVTNARTTVRVAAPRNKKKINRGNKPTVTAGTTNGDKKAPAPPPDNRTNLAKLYDAVF